MSGTSANTNGASGSSKADRRTRVTVLVALTANLVIAVAKAVVAGRAPRRTSPDPLGVTGLIVLGVTLAVIGMVLHANEARESPAATGERGGA